METFLNINSNTLKDYYNVIKKYVYSHGHMDDDFLDYCYDVASLELDGDTTLANEYSKDNMYAQIIISSAEFLESHMIDD